MSDSLTTQLLKADVEVPCPECGYPMWMRHVEIIVQTAIICACCYTRVWLRDSGGTVHGAGDVIEQHMRDALKGFS